MEAKATLQATGSGICNGDTPGNKPQMLPLWVNPSYDSLMAINKGEDGSYTGGLVSKIDLPAGALFARLTGLTVADKAFSSLQAGPHLHVEVNSPLCYANHSCDPTLEYHMDKFEVYVRRDRALEVGDPLTFFYPSTEWKMARPFKCWCGAEKCCGWIAGARDMSQDLLTGYWLNDFILEKRDNSEGSGKSGD